MYSTTGGMWQVADHITYSFAPDGTDIGGYSSSLFKTMSNAGFTTANWELQFQKAAAVWQSVSGINMVQVPDNGASFGTSGNQQGDARFGDIRIGGVGLASNVLAQAFLPPTANGGSVAGDIVMNTSQSWRINSNYDLETVAIHEIGHALGMSHSSIQSADMYASYQGVRQTLSSDDAAGIQSVYGAPTPDAFYQQSPNGSFASAAEITSFLNGQGQAALPNLEITSPTKYAYYHVVVPANTNGNMTVTLQSVNLSSLSPRLSVFNGSQQSLGTALSSDFGATISVTVTGVSAGQGFYIRAMANTNGPGGNGMYGMSVNFGSNSTWSFAAPNSAVAAQASTGGGTASDSTAPSSGGGLLGGLLHIVGGLLDGVLNLIHIGTLDGYGDSLATNPHVQAAAKPAHHATHHHTAPVHHHPRPNHHVQDRSVVVVHNH
jgi:Matrixin